MSLTLAPSDDQLIVPLATGVLLLEPGPALAGVVFDAPWSGAGAGTTNVASDGTAGAPRFEYHVNAEEGEWTFSTTAGSGRKVSIAWSYAGFHAWFDQRVQLERFVSRAGSEVERATLVQTGPGRGGTAPSGGFACSGLSAFEVKPGDVYGFRMSGRNFGF